MGHERQGIRSMRDAFLDRGVATHRQWRGLDKVGSDPVVELLAATRAIPTTWVEQLIDVGHEQVTVRRERRHYGVNLAHWRESR